MTPCLVILFGGGLLWPTVGVVMPSSAVRKVSPFEAFLNLDPSSAEEEARFIDNAKYSMARSSHLREGGARSARQKDHFDARSSLKDKWIFFRGDSTIRVVVAALFGSVLDMREEELKDFARTSDKCTRPSHMSDYKAFQARHPEYGNYSCYVNEKICNFNLRDFNLTYDWQHLIFESRERYLFDPHAVRRDPDHDFHHGLPDVMVVGLPLHPCIHTNPKGSDKYPLNQPALEKNYTAQIQELFTAVRSVFHGPVFWMEAGGYTRFSRQSFHTCLDSMNTELARVTAVDKDSYLVKRAAIEKRWVRDHFKLATDLHKPPEVNQQVGQQLLNAMTQAKLM